MAELRRLPGSPLSWCLFLTIQGLWNILQTESKEMLWQSISFYLTVHLLSMPLWTTLAMFSGSWAFVLTLVLLSSSLQVGFHLTPKSWASVRGYKAQWFLVIHSFSQGAEWIHSFIPVIHSFSQGAVSWEAGPRFSTKNRWVYENHPCLLCSAKILQEVLVFAFRGWKQNFSTTGLKTAQGVNVKMWINLTRWGNFHFEGLCLDINKMQEK